MKKINISMLLIIMGQLLITSCSETPNDVVKNEVIPTTNVVIPSKKTEEVILDLKKVSNKNEEEVEGVLGKADRTEKVKGYPCENANCKRVFYTGEKIEIIFKDEMSNRITIYSISDLTSDDNALAKLGLKNEKPTFKNPENVIRWENTQNFAEISFFTDYALIQVIK